MTHKQFKKLIIKAIEEKGFVVYTNKDENFEHMDEEELAIVGEDIEKETFGIRIVKVNPNED